MDETPGNISDSTNQRISMSEQRYGSSSAARLASSVDDCRSGTGATSLGHSMSTPTQALHSVCTVSAVHLSVDTLKLPPVSSQAHQLASVSVAQETSYESIPSSTYEIVHHNGPTLNSRDSNNASVLWGGNLEQKTGGVSLAALSSGQELSSQRDIKLKNRSVHTSMSSTLHNSALIHENQEALMHAYISRSLPEILEPHDAVGVHGMAESSQQLEDSMNSVQESQTMDGHLMALPEDKNLSSGILLNDSSLSVTSFDKSGILNMSNVYSVAPSQVSTSLRSHALTLDTSVHTIQSAMMRTNEYDQHSHNNIGGGGNRVLVGGDCTLHARAVQVMSSLEMQGGAQTHPNDILTNDGDSLHLPSVDLSSNLMDQMNSLNHLSAPDNSCDNLKFDCLVETLPCYRCKICPFLSLSKEVVEQHLRNTHSKLLTLNPVDDVQNPEQQTEKSEPVTSNVQRAHEINSDMSDANTLSKDVTFICGMCDKVFPFIESCSAHMAVEHNIPADNVQLEPMNQTSLSVHNLIPSSTIAALTGDQHHHHHHQPLPSLLPSLRPKLPLVSVASTFISSCQESHLVTASAPTKRGKPPPPPKTKPVVIPKLPPPPPPKIAPKNVTQKVKSEVEIKSPPANETGEEIASDGSSNEVEKKADKTDESDAKNSSKKRGRPKGSKALKVVAAKKVTNRGKANNQNDTRFRCERSGCAIRMRSMDNMEYHLRSHAGTGFLCPECREKFDNWKTLSIHLWRIHVVDMELYTCDICNYKTYSYGKLINMHRRIHSEDRPFLCDTCGKGFKTSKQLRNHRVIHLDKRKHRNLRSGECDICHRRFSDRRMLRVHNDTVHSKLRPYLCNFCGYAASCRSTLKMHIRQHTGEKPFACEKCEYRTADHNSLRRHKMRHSGEKPYRCPFCPYGCIQSSTYKTHLKNKHPGLDEGLMFCCQQCSFRTIKKENFVTHMVDHNIRSENRWAMDGMTDTTDNIPVSSSSAEVKMGDVSASYLPTSLPQPENVPVSLQSHLEVIPQYVYSVQEDINQGVTHQVISMDNDNPEERFPILAGQLKLGHIAGVDDAAAVHINSSLDCSDAISMQVAEEPVSGNGRDRVRVANPSLQDDHLLSESSTRNALGHNQLVTLHPLSPSSILPDHV